MLLYHGSNITVDKPRLVAQKRYLDFGFGFYTTASQEQAVSFARKVAERRKRGAATLNTYSVDETVAFRECRLLRFDGPDGAWLDFVAANRQGTYQGMQYAGHVQDARPVHDRHTGQGRDAEKAQNQKAVQPAGICD